jgi:hypothetical protein
MAAAPEDLTIQDLIEQSRRRRQRRLRGRDRIVEPVLFSGFLCVAVPMALLSDGGHSWSLPVVPLLLAYVVASRIEFEVGGGYTVPTQLLYVPMLFVLPTGTVPLAVAGCFVAAKLPGYLSRRIRPARAIADVGDAWHAVGPALVLALAGATHPDWGDWPIYLIALAAQFSVDLAANTVPRVSDRRAAGATRVDGRVRVGRRPIRLPAPAPAARPPRRLRQ